MGGGGRSFVYNAVKHKLLPDVELNPKLFKALGPGEAQGPLSYRCGRSWCTDTLIVTIYIYIYI